MDIENAVSTPEGEPAGEIEATTEHEISAEAPEAKTLDDALDAAFQSVGQGNDSEAADPTSAMRGDEATDVESPDEKSGKPARERDEQGRFKAGDKRTDEPADQDGTEAKDAETDDSQSLNAPETWPAKDREAFAALPKESQNFLVRREKEMQAAFTRKTQEASEQIKTAQALDGLFSDEEKVNIQRSGQTPVSLLGQMTQFYRWYQQDPVGYVQHVIQSAGLDPSRLFPHPNQNGADPNNVAQPGEADSDEWVDPELQQLKQSHSELQRRLQAQQQGIPDYVSQQVQDGIAQWQHQQQVDQVNSLVATAQSAVDDNGQLRYPHFDRLKPLMGMHIQQNPDYYGDMPDGLAKIDAAYKAALKSDPQFGDEYIRAEAERLADETARREAEANSRAQQQATVDKAKRAAPPLRPSSTAPGATRSTKGDLDSILTEAIRQHSR